MKITRDKNKKILWLVVIGAVAVLGIGVAAAYYFKFWPFLPKQTISKVDDTAQKTVHESPKNTNTVSKDEVTPDTSGGKTSDQVPVDTAMTATISELQQTGDSVTFNSKITNSPTAGTCVVTFSNPNDRPVVKQFTGTVSGSTATCGPISVSSLEFSYLGEWNVSLRYFINNKQATAESKIIIR